MHRKDNTIFIKPFRNLYCDAIACSLGKYMNVYDIDENQILNLISLDEVETLIEYAVLKNKLAGVGELNIKVPEVGLGRKFLDKYQIRGKEILSARQMSTLTAGEVVGGRIGFDIENLLDYAEGFLAELSDFTGRLDIPIFISLGRDIEEVGKLVNRYNMSPADVLESFGFLDRECFLYGLNYIDKDDQKLLKTYDKTIVFMPKNDGEEGKGAINLFNFVYNGLKFCFSSGKCYNVDMLGEVKLAITNTSNLMHERGLLSNENLLSALQVEEGEEEVEIPMDESEKEDNIFDKKVLNIKESLLKDYYPLEEKIVQIVKRIKEKI